MSGVSPITTHVLDLAEGKPALGIHITLEREGAKGWEKLGEGKTDNDGRLKTLLSSESKLASGVHRLTFETYRRSRQPR